MPSIPGATMAIGVDIKTLREPAEAEKFRVSEKRRFRKPELIDQVLALDEAYRKANFDREQFKKKITKEVMQPMAQRKKESKGADACEDLIALKDKLEVELEVFVKAEDEALTKRDEKLGTVGNLIDDSVPVSKDEDKDNEVVATWGTPRAFTEKYQTNGFRPHFELLEMIGGVNFDAGRDVAGDRAYFLMGPAVLLNQSLINFGLAFLMKEGGYTPIQPPFFMNASVMAQAAELKDYDDVLYKIVEDEERPELDKYLIATSEQPITALYRNKIIDRTTLPLRYAGTSSCFRKEAGSSGRDIRGTFRVHQFEKIEQFVICEPEKSHQEHLNIISQAEKFFQSLEFPYRVVNIVSGEINDAASKKFDLEAWFPGDKDGKGQYRELVSASNCLDFQSRRMATRADYLSKAEGKKKAEGDNKIFPHMLNSTLCATERAMCCLLENYQTPTGIRVPRVLVPFMAGLEFIPFVKPPPKF